MFNYRIAESILDKWCLSDARTPGFRRSYVKLKMGVYALAFVDYNEQGKFTEATKARGWEELQMTCTARGEACTSGLLAQVWGYCRVEEKPDLRRLFETAFALAEEQTEPTADRLYPKRYRLAAFDWLQDNPPDVPPVAPYRGPKLVDIAINEGWDVDLTLRTFADLMQQDQASTKLPSLELLEGGREESGP